MGSEHGYAGKILRVDLSRGSTTEVPTAQYANRFVGGKGIAAKIYWDEVLPSVKAFDPDNRLIFATGPLAGIPRLAGSRWLVCGKSPCSDPESFSFAHSGGSCGAWLKFAGYDGLVVQGTSNSPVYLLIEDGKTEIRDASLLWGKGAIETRELLKKAHGKDMRVVTTGPAGENMVMFATLLADDDTSATGGFGAVMGSKKLKAIAVRGSRRYSPADSETLRQLADTLPRERKDSWITQTVIAPGPVKKSACYGCITGCSRQTYESKSGVRGKFMCQSATVYMGPAQRYYKGWTEVPFLAYQLCNEYCLDTEVLQPMIPWLFRCHRQGIMTDENTGLALSQSGSLEFFQDLVRKISFKEGFGSVLAQGTLKAAEIVGKGAKDLIGDSVGDESSAMGSYDPRLLITTALFYATEPRKPLGQLHEIGQTVQRWVEWVKNEEGSYYSTEVFRLAARRFFGGEIAIDFSTYDGKALAAKIVQDREHVKDSLVLCDFSWPLLWAKETEEHVGEPAMESKVFSAVTGNKVDEEELYLVGERVCNIQRAILAREGRRGGEKDKLLDFYHDVPLKADFHNKDCLVPGKGGEVMSRKGQVVDRAEFKRMMQEFYHLRGWDASSGLPTKKKLHELYLDEVAEGLEAEGLLP